MAPISFAILVLACVAVGGLLLGTIRIRGIGLGPAGVLFLGILFGHFGASIDHDIAEFAKEFGLVLFVFTIGLQLGPGILQLWKQQGLVLNTLAFSVVALGALIVIGFSGVIDLTSFSAPGLFSGATTNTPSLGAAQQAASEVQGAEDGGLETMSLAYAVAYPGGIIGIIASMLLLKLMFRIDVEQESNDVRSNGHHHAPIERRCILVDNPHLSGIPFGGIPGSDETGVRISRVKRVDDDVVHPATTETKLQEGDMVQVVGTAGGLDRFEPLIGRRCSDDLMETKGDAEFRRIVVTEPKVLNRPLRELSLDHLYNVSVTRIRRSGVEMTARGSSRLHYGDVAHIVGNRESLDRVTELLGNSVKALNETHFAPVFLGIAAGVVLGMIPVQIPGVPFPVRLGLAGGPLVAAILLSLIGRIGRIVWYIPYSANLALRELGIILFLASAGLSAGESFFDVVMTSRGAIWMLAGFVVTTVPLLAVGAAARVFGKLNYLTICGVIAGSMTDPPALAFANSLSDTDTCATAYAAVYPLTMILRIVAAQSIVYIVADSII